MSIKSLLAKICLGFFIFQFTACPKERSNGTNTPNCDPSNKYVKRGLELRGKNQKELEEEAEKQLLALQIEKLTPGVTETCQNPPTAELAAACENPTQLTEILANKAIQTMSANTRIELMNKKIEIMKIQQDMVKDCP